MASNGQMPFISIPFIESIINMPLRTNQELLNFDKTGGCTGNFQFDLTFDAVVRIAPSLKLWSVNTQTVVSDKP
jgi:hypothetical protein